MSTMEENPEIIDKFASVLKEKLSERPLAPYAASVYQNQWISRPENSFTAKDVIDEVSKQIKAIQNADCVAGNKRTSNTLNKYKKSTFLPLNMLSKTETSHDKPQPMKPEMSTQFTMDTQLMNVIRAAEALPGTSGVTQEFDSTFYPDGDGEELEDDPICNRNQCPILDISLKAPNPKKILNPRNIDTKHDTQNILNPEKLELNDKNILFDKDMPSCSKDFTFDTKDTIQGRSVSCETILCEDNDIFDENIASTSINIMLDVNNDLLSQQGSVKHENIEWYEENCVVVDETESINDNDKKYLKPQVKMCLEVLEEGIDDLDSLVKSQDVKMPSSPILRMKTKSSYTDSSSSLVVDLRCFEKFEEIATPVIEKYSEDFEGAKEIISSQISAEILGEVVCGLEHDITSNLIKNEIVDFDLQAMFKEDRVLSASHLMRKAQKQTNIESHSEDMFENAKSISNDSDENIRTPISVQMGVVKLNTDNQEDMLQNITERLSPIKQSISDKQMSDGIIDEILFSSDEENEYIHKSIQDLPLTCALETSFYEEQSEILDKTMYVGFHTASNKSIKVLTDSFSRAKSFLGDMNGDKEEKTVSELVNMCSSNEQYLKSVKSGDKTQLEKLLKDDNFEDKLEAIKERITNTITTDFEHVTCEDLTVASKLDTECLEIDIGNLPGDNNFTSNVTAVAEDQNWSNHLLLKKADTFEGTEYSLEDKTNIIEERNDVEVLDGKDTVVTSQELFDETDHDGSSTIKIEPYTTSQIISFTKPKLVTEVCMIKSDSSTDEYMHLPIVERKEIDLYSEDMDSNTDDTSVIEPIVYPGSQIISVVKNHKLEERDQPEIKVINKNEKKSPINEIPTRDSELSTDGQIVRTLDEELPSSQIISIKTPRRQKRKQEWSPTSANKRSKVEYFEETSKGSSVEDIEFDTCDFKDISLKDSEINTASHDLKKESKEVTNSEDNDPGNIRIGSPKTKSENAALNFLGFKTASNRNIELSKEAIARSKEIFQEITDDRIELKTSDANDNLTPSNIKPNGNTESDIDNSGEPPLHGFLITEEYKMKVIKEIETCRRIFADLEFEKSIFEPDQVENVFSQTNTDNDNATNKPGTPLIEHVKDRKTEAYKIENSATDFQDNVSCSEEKVSDAIRNSSIYITPYKEKEEHYPSLHDFPDSETSNNESIKLSTEAMTKIEYFFRDVDKMCEENSSLDKQQNTPACAIFQESKKESKKPVKFTAKSVARAKKIFQNQDLDCDTFEFKIPNAPIFEGFQTASKKPYHISGQALKRSKKIFQDIEDNILDPKKSISAKDPIDKKPLFQGFQMASKNPVHISSRALAMANKIFENINLTEEDEPTSSGYLDDSFCGKFEGFKTASTNEVKISDEALAISRKIFHDIDSEAAMKSMIIENKSFKGFKTASNKEAKISNEALAKTKIFFQDINLEVAHSELKSIASENKTFEGFETASNKEIKISNEALAKSRQIFQDIDSKTAYSGLKTNTIKNKSFQGFKTASNKDVIVSDEALNKSEKIFKDINDINPNIAIYNSDIQRPIQTEFQCFQTACNKQVKISNEALAKRKRTFQDDDEEKATDNVVIQNFQGFQTANNKQVKISDEALAKSRKIFQDIDEDRATDNAGIQKFQGFQTASNKQVKISDEALAKSRKIFQDIDEDKATDNAGIQKFQGFQTASNKQVKISDEALANSRKIFQDIDEDKATDNAGIQKFQGFQTASNKQVKISDEALANSRKIFQDIDEDKATDNAGIQKFQGFQTASNKQVKISDEALANSRKIFQDIDEDKATDNAGIQKFQGFQTASNKQVKISDEALANSRKIFQDIDEKKATDNAGIQKFQGFQTASNKQVKISDEALAKSRKIFQDIDEEKGTDNAGVHKFQGFQTASNKQVKISDEMLAKSRKIFQDIGEDNASDLVIKKFQGFKTASKKEVKISDKALCRSKSIFQDFDLNAPSTSNKDTIEFQGFSTASSKKVIVSKQALEKSKMFKDLEPDIQTLERDPKLLDFGFKTASNTKIVVSEEALAKSRRLFATDMDESETKRDKTNIIINENIEHNDLINTQVLNNFEQTLHSEDFLKDTMKSVPNDLTPKSFKRSGSPILSCPRTKKRKKFEIPYSQKVAVQKDNVENVITVEEIDENPCLMTFEGNYKKIKKYTLKDLTKLEMDDANDKIDPDPYILNFNFANLLDFEFLEHRNDLDEPTGETKIKDVDKTKSNKKDLNETKITTKDLIQKFQNSVSKTLIPNGWTENHLKLILWKLISYEIKFPKTMKNICTAKNVIEQLKYRYDRELFNAERPALRKILEKDDVPSRTLVLCVAAILDNGVQVIRPKTPSNMEVLLTDGWYLIKASTDPMLSRLVCEDKISVGSKIVTCGAELVGGEQGVAPWEDTSSVRLKLSGNSTRRAHWAARLGYHGNAAILSPLTAVKPDGGKVAKLRAFVARVYPALYVEKFEDGSTVTRSERLEHIYQSVYETDRQAIMEKLYEEVQKELFDQESQESQEEQPLKRQCLDSGSQILRAMTRSKDPQEYRHNLTSTQQNLLESYECKKQELYIQNFQDRVQEKISKMGLNVSRNVVPLLKARIVGVDDINGAVHVTRAMLSIWKPNEAIREIVKEGTWIEVMNVVPTAVRYSETQISAGRQSIFNQSKYQAPENLTPHINSLKRTCYPIKEVVRNPNMNTEYNEIDTVGIIFEIDPKKKDYDPNKHQFQNIYLTDAEKNMICVNFWGGLKKFGFENVLDTGQIVACTNLQKRSGNTRKNVPQYRATEFTYFTKTPRSDNARKIVDDLGKKMAGIDTAKFCSDCVDLRNSFSLMKLQNHSENVSPYRFPNIDIHLSRNKVFIDSPLAQKTSKTDENLNLTGLDFESTFNQAETQEISPKTLLRKRQVKEKLQKLQRYGEPPPLSPITILNKSRNAGNAYKSPLISKMESSVASDKKILTNREISFENACGHSKNAEKTPLISKLEPSVASDKNIETNQENSNETSPIIGLNRTYVKRPKVNPVKLDFSRNIDNDSVDQFADEFDGSPPLSLD